MGTSLVMRQRATHTALRTCRWAKIMTAWLIGRNRGKGAKWHVVDFVGPNGCESRGVVDLLAVRKNHTACDDTIKRGDLLDIVLIQVKGGSASLPTQEDIDRLRKIARHHRARAIFLCEWKRQKCLRLYLLRRNRWIPAKRNDVF